jgi:hypothetical protein
MSIFLLGCSTNPQKSNQMKLVSQDTRSNVQVQTTPEAGPDAVVSLVENGIRISFDTTIASAGAMQSLKGDDGQLAENCWDVKSQLNPTNQILVREDQCSQFAKYPLLVKIDNDGWLFFAPNLFAADARIKFQDLGQLIALPAGNQATNGFVFLGPESAVYQSEGVTVVSSSQSREKIHKKTVQYVNFWTELLGQPSAEPIVIVPSAATRALQAAHASNNGVIVLPDEFSFDDRLIAHELFHLWNGRSFNDNEADLNRWLLEGVAEYAALLSMVAISGVPTEANSFLSSSLNSCRAALRQRSLIDVVTAKDSEQVKRLHYSCGLAIAWFADSEIVSKSNGRKSIFHILDKLFDQSAGYESGDFLLALRQEIGESSLAENLISSERDVDWNFAVSQLKSVNQFLENAVTQESMQTAVIMAIAGGLCPSKAYGYEISSDGRIFLDVDSTCNAIDQRTELVMVGGLGTGDVTLEDGTNILQDCLDSKAIEATLKTNSFSRTVRVPCSGSASQPKRRLIATPDWNALISAARTVSR